MSRLQRPLSPHRQSSLNRWTEITADVRHDEGHTDLGENSGYVALMRPGHCAKPDDGRHARRVVLIMELRCRRTLLHRKPIPTNDL